MNHNIAKHWSDWQRHHDRYRRFVEHNGLPCQECGGEGGYVEAVIDYGRGPWQDCGWCEGTGKVTRWVRGLWLQMKRECKVQ